MKEIELFYLANCPYCRNARKAIEELTAETPAYQDIRVKWIEESQEPELTIDRDYYYVPTIFYGGTKLYEAKPGQDFGTIKTNIAQSFKAVLEN